MCLSIILNNFVKKVTEFCPQMPIKKSANKKSAFLEKTYEILQKNEYGNIIQWHPNDCGFIIKDLQNFTNQILPHYFKHSNFTSFVRQLNMYGFSKQKTADTERYYLHPNFRRNEKNLLFEIARKMQKRMMKNHKVEQQKVICSQLSIQLEKAENESVETKLCSQLQELRSVNETLVDIQLDSINEIMSDIKCMQNHISEQERQRMCSIMSKYIKAHKTFLTQFESKSSPSINSGSINKKQKFAESKNKIEN